MKIIVNDEKIELPYNSTIKDLIIHLGYHNHRIAIEINESIIPKSSHASFPLNSKDKVEIINAVGGG